MVDFRDYLSEASTWIPEMQDGSAWTEHAPFAFWLMQQHRPRVVVELGTLNGYSFLVFCQAVRQLSLPARAYAVDTWQGDEHSGFYGEEVFAALSKFQGERYSAFSQLVRSTFDEALPHFEDGSIDLLHIDGRHFYEDVKHDFESWLPKLSDSAVVLFHDTNVRERNFGVFRLWSELRSKHPHFEFLHGHGLGVLGLGEKQTEPMQALYRLSKLDREASAVREIYARLGGSLADRFFRARADANTAEARRAEAQLRTKVEAGSIETAQLHRQLEARGNRIAALEGEVTAKAGQVDTLRDEIATLDDQVAALRDAAAVAEHTHMALRSEVATVRLEAREADAELKRASDGRAALEEQISAVYRSHSWRVTAPLRRVARLLWTTKLSAGRRLELLPEKDVHDPASIGSRTRWRMTGNDPSFRVDWGSRLPLPHGLYRIQFEAEVATPQAQSARVYIDAGTGFSEHGAVWLNQNRAGTGMSAYVAMPEGAAAMRFDPSDAAGEVTIGRARLRKLSRAEFYLRAAGRLALASVRSGRSIRGTARSVVDVARRGGIRGLASQIRQRAIFTESWRQVRSPSPARGRAATSAGEEQMAPGGLAGAAVAEFAYRPLVSVVMPVFNVAAEWLRKAVASVQQQTYDNWELCICDDGSSNRETIDALAELAAGEPRLRLISLQSNRGISAATNQAIAMAQGEFVAFLDNDDELAPRALEACVAALNREPNVDVIYSDEDKLNRNGQHEEPHLKPDWSPHLLREVMYVGHLLVARRGLIEQVGGLDATYDGVQDFELMLRLSEQTSAIRHVPEILYHWRRIPGSVADHSEAKPELGVRQAAAVNAHLARTGVQAFATPHPRLAHRAVVQPLPRIENPLVSIVVCTKDAPQFISRCLDSIYTLTSYPRFEVVVVDNGTTDLRALAAIDHHPVVRVSFPEKFNFSRANNLGVAAARGEVVVLLNNDTEIIAADWVEQMLFLLEEPGVGAVGPMLTYPDGTVQHAGIALGLRGTADHVLRGHPADGDGYFGSLACTREVSGVTFACVMVRKADYLAVGGLQESYATHYQDVDFCLRLRERGYSILYTPRARILHHESVTRGTTYDMMDRALLLDAWGEAIGAGDPFARWETGA